MTNRRVLDRLPIGTLAEHAAIGGLRALHSARATDPAVIIDLVTDAGLRGRGGAGFPTGVKWRTVADNATSSPIAPTVVVNAAEGEPGTFGDRAILAANPYRVLEGALIAAHAVGARSIVVTTKERFTHQVDRLRVARDEMRGSGVLDGVDIEIVTGPSHYLLGEETALLEATAGRPPFPRIAPPYRHGTTEVVDIDAGESGASRVHLASEGGDAPPTLVNNVETLAHVPGIVQHGARWFRMLGTDESPGTSVFTVSGDTRRAGVGEFPLGTPVGDIISDLGGGVEDGEIAFVLSGIANGVLTADELDTPATYEAMDDRGSGLGTGGFLVFSTETDPIAVAHGVSRFLAIESCGQCTPCKDDGLEVARLLDAVRRGDASQDQADAIAPTLARVPEGARCDLARQHERIVASILDRCAGQSVDLAAESLTRSPVLIAPITGFDDDGNVEIDEDHSTKQPDWTHDERSSGTSPAERYDVAVSIS